MASLLYRLGKFAATKRWWFLASWLVVLIVIGASAGAFMGKLSNTFSIPGTPTQITLDKVKQELPDLAGGTGTVVFQAKDGKLTSAQETTIESSLKQLKDDGLVKSALDPFAMQKQLDESASKIADGRAELAKNQKKLDDGKKALDAGKAKLESGQKQLDAGYAKLYASASVKDRAGLEATIKQLKQGGAATAAQLQQLSGALAQLDAEQAKLDQASAALPKQEKELKDGQAKLDAAGTKLDLADRTAEASKGMRFVSADGTTAVASLQFTGQVEALSAADRQQLQDTLNQVSDQGVEVLYSKEILSDLNSFFGPGEAIGMAIAAVVLFVMMGTFVGAGLPLLMAVIGVGAGVGGTLAFSSLIEMASITPALAQMLGLAVGIDYSLFIMHRHRKQLLAGMEPIESIGRAVGTSGNAVVFAGLTVVIALAALVVPGLPFLSVLGLSAAATVALSVLVSLTLTPALLGFIGTKLVSRRAWRKQEAKTAAEASGASNPASNALSGNRRGWGAMTTRHPWVFAIASIALLATIAIPALSLRTALPDGSQEAYGSSAQRAYELTSDKFGAGFNGPLLALVELPGGQSKEQAEATMLDVADQIRDKAGVVAAVPAQVNADRSYGALQIVPTDGPSSASIEELIHTLRDDAGAIQDATGARVDVTGQVGAQIDVSEKLAQALPPYLGIVVGLSLLLLLLVFRSIVVPLLATAGFLLSLTAAFGATVAVYQWGWLGPVFDVHVTGPIMSFLPILLTGILFGLAMDYQVFLVSAMREAYVHGAAPREAVRAGFRNSAPVVTAAALIMASVFAGFVFSHLPMIRPIGFALAIGVLADAFVVRMTLTPAVMTLLGKHAWYIPRWLDRILPDVDVEGAKLASLAQAPAASTEEAKPTGGEPAVAGK